MKKIFYLFLVFNLFIISACDSSGGSSGGGVIPNSITVQGDNIIYIGDEQAQYTATLNPANFTAESVVWSSDNDTVGTIDNATGLFTAKAQGTVNITASAGGVKSAPFNVIVTIKPDTVAVAESPASVNVGESAQFSYSITPADIEYKEVIWNVDNTTIASINKDTGELIGNIAGTVNVTVTVNGVTSAPYPVTVILPVEGVTINGPDTVSTLSQAVYTVVTSPEGSTVTNVVWSIDNTNLATIGESTGELITKADAGQITITANADGNVINKIVNIIKKLEISGSNTTAIGETITLSVANNITNNLTWNSSNPNVATVVNGVVTGVSAGSTDITVSENGNTSAPFTVTVTDSTKDYEIVDGVYNVYTVAGFKAWVEAVNANTSTSCNLYSDLDFANEASNTMIDISYKGTFNGNGHIIKNYAIPNGNAFIKEVSGSKGKLLNTIFDNVSVTSTNKSTGIVTTSNFQGTIENVHVRNSEIIANSNGGYNNIGIIAGEAFSSTTKNCTVTNSTITVTGIADNVGGIIGVSKQGSIISGCFVDNLNVSAQGSNYNTTGIGGIVGQQQGSSSGDTVIGCGVANTTLTNTGTNIKGRVGGLIAAGGSILKASYFYGSVENQNNNAASLDYNNFSGTAISTLFVKQKGGSIGKYSEQTTKLVDDTNVTWETAVNEMNQALIDNGYTDFVFKYDATKGYPVIEYTQQ